MPRRHTPHPCALPGCDVMHKNAKYCCKDHEYQAVALSRLTETRRCRHCGDDHPAVDFLAVASSGRKTYLDWCKTCRDSMPDAQARRDATNAAINARKAAAREVRATLPERAAMIPRAHGQLWPEDLRLGHPAWPVQGNSILGAPFAA